jgi:hypothetical protein
MGMVMVRKINYWYISLSLEETDMVIIRVPENEQKQGENYQDRPVLCRVQLKRADKFWTLVPHTKTRKYVHISMCPETLIL